MDFGIEYLQDKKKILDVIFEAIELNPNYGAINTPACIVGMLHFTFPINAGCILPLFDIL